jgi:flagellar M-ring protein FliF
MDAMELIRKYIVQMKGQLIGLTVSQKLLIGLLVVVMVATIFFAVVFSAKPAMVPLFPQAMTAEEINKVEMAIKTKYEYQVSGDKILVPVETAYSVRGELAAMQALPKSFSSALSRAMLDNNPFQTEAQKQRQWEVALHEELTRMLRGFPYVEDGEVVFDRGRARGLGIQGDTPTATVNVKVKGGAALTANQVIAIADMVSGAVPRMRRQDVRIIGDGQRSYHAPSSDAPMPTDMLEFKNTIEQSLTQKLYTMFETMGDVKIAVNAVPDLSVRERETQAYDPKTTVVKPVTETSRETNSTEGTVPEGQPGVQPNTRMGGAGAAGGRRQNSTSADTSTQNVVMVGSMRERVSLPAGVEIKELTASLSLPRSYFVSLFRRAAHDPKADPDDDKLQPIIDREVKKVQQSAKNVIGAKADDQVQVAWYDDAIGPAAGQVALASVGIAGGGMPAVIGQYAKQGVLAAVALGAMGMMLMMVRRAVPAADGGEVDPSVFFGGGGGRGKGKRKGGEVDQLNAGDDVFGEANEGNAVLTGIELDDETLQSRRIVDEVSAMIKENPENAAALVKRWMSKNK